MKISAFRCLSAVVAVICLVTVLTACGQSATSQPTTSPTSAPTSSTPNTLPECTTDKYVADPSSFVPVWADQWTPPAWLTEFGPKSTCFTAKPDRLMSFAHRGDIQHYPENSLESILSCIAMGVDAIELDVAVTKDGVLVLSHDETLTRCTDWLWRKYTEADKFPQSDYICDWTWEELKQLRLLDNTMQSSSCRIPSLAEVVQVCSGKIMILLDRFGATAKIAGVSTSELRFTSVADICAQYDTEPCCVAAWEFGKDGMQTWGEYDPAKREQTEVKFLSPSVNQYCIEGATLTKANDNVDVWREMDELGYDIIMTNYPLDMVKYIAETYAPAA